MGRENYTLSAKDIQELIGECIPRPACDARFGRLEKWFVAFLFVMLSGTFASVTALIVLLVRNPR